MVSVMGPARRSVLVTIGVISVVLSCGEIREDEMLCEESVSKLTDCCPNIEPHRFVCIYDQSCGGQFLKPVFSAKASGCIHDRTCDELRARGTCEQLRAMSLDPNDRANIPAFEAEACK
jgi:hypothetical protein